VVVAAEQLLLEAMLIMQVEVELVAIELQLPFLLQADVRPLQ